VHAVEAHGCLCGALCARRVFLPSEWLEEILADSDDENSLETVAGALADLYDRSASDLDGIELEFSPLLPDDDAPVEARVAALAEWCQGFLYGIGASGTLANAVLGDDMQEFLTDLAELTRVDASGEADAEAEEEAYAELVEYVRVGVQLVYDQLAVTRAGQPEPPTQH